MFFFMSLSSSFIILNIQIYAQVVNDYIPNIGHAKIAFYRYTSALILPNII